MKTGNKQQGQGQGSDCDSASCYAKKISDIQFNSKKMMNSEDTLYFHDEEGFGKITILDRMTGFGWRDVETGYTDADRKFWLASGDFSIKNYPKLTIKEAIELIKSRANTCTG